MRRHWLLILPFSILSGPSAAGETLIDLSSRDVLEADASLGDGRALIYVEKNCPACMAYLRRLPACPEDLRKRIVFVSLDSPGTAKGLNVPEGARLTVRKHSGEAKIKATPLTRTKAAEKSGILSCAELRALLP